jgi:hypothetical protein
MANTNTFEKRGNVKRESDYPRCPYCQGLKRGWRRLYEETLCSRCEKNGVEAGD